MADLYALLGVDPSATNQDIERAYRRLIRQYHPDLNHDPHAQDISQRLNEARSLLLNPARRARYDRSRIRRTSVSTTTSGMSVPGTSVSYGTRAARSRARRRVASEPPLELITPTRWDHVIAAVLGLAFLIGSWRQGVMFGVVSCICAIVLSALAESPNVPFRGVLVAFRIVTVAMVIVVLALIGVGLVLTPG